MKCAPLYSTPHTPGRKNLAKVGVELAGLLGLTLMEWQTDAIALFTEIDETEHFAYRDMTLLVGRQNAKSTTALILFLIRCYSTPGTRCIYGAQTLKASREMLLETWWSLISGSPLEETVQEVRRANGAERILFKNGSSIQLLTTTSASAGHGQTIDFGILDEAFAQKDAHVEAALVPAMSTRSDYGGGGGPQYIVTSNAGSLDGQSPYLWDRVERGRALALAGTTSTSAYLEYGAPPDADPSLESTWLAATPAAGITISLDAIRAEYESMPLSEFQRARLCQWTVQANDPAIDLMKWAALEDRQSEIVGDLLFATDVAPGRDHSSISVAGKRPDGNFHVEVIRSQSGTAWLPKALRKLMKSHQPIGVYVDAQTTSLVPEIEESGVYVTKLEAADAAASFAFLLEAVADGTVRWRSNADVDGGDLRDALIAGVTRPLTDGGNGWSRRATPAHIDNLVSVTLALWAARSRLSDGTVNIYGPGDYLATSLRLEDEEIAQQDLILFTGREREDEFHRLIKGRTEAKARMIIRRTCPNFSEAEIMEHINARREVLAS